MGTIFARERCGEAPLLRVELVVNHNFARYINKDSKTTNLFAADRTRVVTSRVFNVTPKISS